MPAFLHNILHRQGYAVFRAFYHPYIDDGGAMIGKEDRGPFGAFLIAL